MEESPFMNKKRLFFKKTAALLLCAVLLLPCSACFNSPEAKNPGNDTGQITDSPHSETRNEAFNDYVNRLFTETVTTDTIPFIPTWNIRQTLALTITRSHSDGMTLPLLTMHLILPVNSRL